VALVRTDVSVEYVASIITVERIRTDYFDPDDEVIRSSKTSILTRATRRNFPEDGILHGHRRENLKSLIIPILSLLYFLFFLFSCNVSLSTYFSIFPLTSSSVSFSTSTSALSFSFFLLFLTHFSIPEGCPALCRLLSWGESPADGVAMLHSINHPAPPDVARS
jgi:hypothetical protein